MISKITSCRICGNTQLVPVIDLGEQYLTGVFPKRDQAAQLTKGPLRLVKCHGAAGTVCGLLQLEHSYDLGEMYGDNYGYRSGLNASMVAHLHGKVARILKQVSLASGDLVVDIGANDGTTLSAYPQHLDLVGIDPTGEKFRRYYPAHVRLVPDFFSAEALRRVSDKTAKVVTSFSMFYDLERPIDFARQIAGVLDPQQGIWVFEQSYLPLMLERMAYDTICHEHLEYYCLRQIEWIATQAGLRVIDVELNDTNGGSFSVTAAHRDSQHKATPAVAQLLAKEDAEGYAGLEPYRAFADKTAASRDGLRAFVAKAKREGKTIYGLGASTKGNVILQYCGFTPEDIEAIGDVNPDKYGAVTPGTLIPIEAEAKVLQQNPDYLLVLPWHFREFFMKSPLLKGRTLVFPLPALEAVVP